MRLPVLCVAASASLLLSCSPGQGAQGPPSGPRFRTVLLEDVPFVRMKPSFGGEACAAMALARLGRNLGQDDVFNASGLKAEIGRGCGPEELAATLRRLGFRTGNAWRETGSGSHPRVAEEELAAVVKDLDEGIPTIVYTRGARDEGVPACYRLVVGYDGRTQEVVYHDPASKFGSCRKMTALEFLRLWPLPRDGGGSGIVRIRLEPGTLVEPPRARGLSEADYVQRIIEVREEAGDGGFHIVLERPFVVAGDEAPGTVQRRAVNTVRWATTLLKRDYFPNDPTEVLAIWLFKDDASYRSHARAIFRDEPSSPFGYYLSGERALIMNIGTGGGTLVHEIVHPLMAANFPTCPPWLNEGMASLYEACSEKEGHIVGRLNWRLPALQQAIHEKRLRSFAYLFAMDAHEFYGGSAALNYAQARYLCYYLQERGLLVDYYKRFAASPHADPTGLEALKETLGEEDAAAFQKRWEAWVLTLSR